MQTEDAPIVSNVILPANQDFEVLSSRADKDQRACTSCKGTRELAELSRYLALSQYEKENSLEANCILYRTIE